MSVDVVDGAYLWVVITSMQGKEAEVWVWPVNVTRS